MIVFFRKDSKFRGFVLTGRGGARHPGDRRRVRSESAGLGELSGTRAETNRGLWRLGEPVWGSWGFCLVEAAETTKCGTPVIAEARGQCKIQCSERFRV